MKKYLAFDTEDDSKGNVLLINFYDGEAHYTFDSGHEALNWLSGLSGNIEIWAVNLSYDLNNLFKDYWHAIEITYIESRIIFAKIRNSRTKFMDTLNHWKVSVKEMGRKIGLPKIEVDPGQISKISRRDLIDYCRRDTEITYRFVQAMRKQYLEIGCDLKATIGSTALKYYETRFDDSFRREQPIDSDILDFIRTGYYGGRTEIFYTEPVRGNIQYFDINSLYPSVMLDYCFPVLKERYWTKKPDFTNEGMCDVTIEAPYQAIPYLPVRSDKGLLFPCGVFRGVYTYFELRTAGSMGYKILKTHNAVEFSGGLCKPFENFVNVLWRRRLQAKREDDVLMVEACKLLMNNLYGKWGQGNEYQKLVPYGKEIEGVVYENCVLQKIKGSYPRHSNGIWACYTTAYARHRLYEGLCRVNDSGGLLIYCDTDSVIFESEREIIRPSDRLGQFKLEGIFKYAHFKLPKLYKLVEASGEIKYRAKGVPRNAGASFFETNRTQFERPFKLRESLRRNLSLKRKHFIIPNYWELTTKEIRQKYNKRKVLKDGTTRPIKVSQA